MDAISNIVDRLAAHRTLAGVPRRELEWLAAHGRLLHYQAGELLLGKGGYIPDLIIQLTGRMVTTVNRASGRRDALETRAGEVSARLPFSRMTLAPGDTHAVEETEAWAIHQDMFPEMIRECPAVIERLVHQMLDRTRTFSSTTLRDEQLQSVGRLAAGLAHELNNPASAAARSSSRLHEALDDAISAATAFGAALVTPEQRARVAELARSSLGGAASSASALDRRRREEAFARWLDEHGVDDRFAEALAESALTLDSLERLAASATAAELDLMVRTIATGFTAHSLARDVQQAADRIHGLVSAVVRFTQLDRAVARGPMNVAQGLTDTVTMLASKAREKSVAVHLEVDGDLPPVHASDDLNQVWLHLIDNAIDGVRDSGEVRVRACLEHDEVVVRVIDDGPGIPPEVVPRMFEPFFTTKPPGKGIGLGLDIVRRVLTTNEGHVAVQADPGRTEFRVALPVLAVPATQPG